MKNIKNDRSIILAVALLAVVIILLNYNKLAGATISTGMGVYTETPTTSIWDWGKETKICSECRAGYCRSWTAFRNESCTKVCGSNSDCQGIQPKPGTVPAYDCFQCSGTNCVRYVKTEPGCVSNCSQTDPRLSCEGDTPKPPGDGGTGKINNCSKCDASGTCRTYTSSSPCSIECGTAKPCPKPKPDGDGSYKPPDEKPKPPDSRRPKQNCTSCRDKKCVSSGTRSDWCIDVCKGSDKNCESKKGTSSVTNFLAGVWNSTVTFLGI